MSVYSGFSTRKLEKDYGALTSTLISLLHYKVVSNYKGTRVNEDAWASKFMQTHSQLFRLESNKHLPPKFSIICEELASILNENFSDGLYRTSDSLHPTLNPLPQIRFPELTRIKEHASEGHNSKNNIRLKKQRVSVEPLPRQLKSEYYERALENYFDVTQHYSKINDEMIQDLSNHSLIYHNSTNSAF